MNPVVKGRIQGALLALGILLALDLVGRPVLQELGNLVTWLIIKAVWWVLLHPAKTALIATCVGGLIALRGKWLVLRGLIALLRVWLQARHEKAKARAEAERQEAVRLASHFCQHCRRKAEGRAERLRARLQK